MIKFKDLFESASLQSTFRMLKIKDPIKHKSTEKFILYIRKSIDVLLDKMDTDDSSEYETLF